MAEDKKEPKTQNSAGLGGIHSAEKFGVPTIGPRPRPKQPETATQDKEK